MKIVSFTTLWPNHQQPLHGLFVRERVKAISRLCDVHVVAPVPWFPPIRWFGQRYYNYSQIARSEQQDPLEVLHPRYLSIPKIAKSLEGLLMFRSLFTALQQMKQTFTFDLIDAHWAYPDGYAASRIARKLGIPYTLTVRGSDINVFAQEQGRGYFVRQGLLHAGCVICVSKELQERVNALGIPAEKLALIENGVDCQKFQRLPKEEARRRLQLPPDARIILSVGHLSELKGFHVLIEALMMLQITQKIAAPLYLVIVGGDAQWAGYKQVLAQQIADNHLQDSVLLAGAKPPDELKYWYSAADLFCLASSREGCPNVILESFACGTPVVATPVGGIPQMIPTEDVGFLVERSPESFSRGIATALDRTWNHDRISQYVQSRYSWESTAAQIYTIFERLMV